MRKLPGLFILFLFSLQVQSQNLSYTCPRDTILGCGINCFDLTVQFPDFKELGTDYTLKNVTSTAACLPYVPPGAPGPSAQLTIDDRYSDVIPLPFPFPFYGTTYNSVIVSTNGYVSFDVSEALEFCHWDDLGNLPNASYDRALIMGPYHDLDPSEPSPSKQVKYQTFGTAPNRKWILSFYKVPLYVDFAGSCNGLIENTHQIILHETTGIVEVDIIDKQICYAWNDGHAMVGMQDFTRTKGIMAPGRRMSDPPWGSIGMNEVWRFYPTGGPTLYRRMELLDGSGAVIATGDTTRVDANTFTWTFPNICPPGNTTATYVVRTTYAHLNNLAQTFYSLDTIRVLRNAMPLSSAVVNTTCGASVGSVTVTATGGTAPLTYTLTPGAITNSTGIFPGLPVGNYTVTVTDASGTCSNTITANVTAASTLTATYTSTNASCPGLGNGSITVTPTTGTAPFSYVANGGTPQATGNFINLDPGTYNISFTDALGCNGSVTAVVAPGTAITASSSSVGASCPGASDGSITITSATGVAPHTYSLDGGPFQAGNTFPGIAGATTHVVTVRDSRGCTVDVTVTVGAGTGITASIFQTPVSCPGTADGTVTLVPTSGVAPYSFSLNGGPFQASGTFTGLAASTSGPYTVVVRDANNCTGQRSINVGGGTTPATTATAASPSCLGASNGVIVFNPVAGATYTVNPGNISNTTGTFNGLPAGTYTLSIATSGGCAGTVTPANITINPGAPLTGTATTVATSCPGVNDGSVIVNPAGAGTTYTLNPGGLTNTTGIFSGLAAGTYTVTFLTSLGCSGTVAANPVVAAGPALTSTTSQVNPVCSNINDGTITIIPQAGSTAPFTATLTGPGGPYTYNGNGPISFSNLAPGTYNYSYGENGGCNGTGGPVTLVTNAPIYVPAAATNLSCNNNASGRIVFNPTGGVTPYEYRLNPGGNFQSSNTFTGLTAATHSFTIRDNAGCTKDTSITLTQPAVLTATVSGSTPAGCSNNDGTITATPVGGTAPYSYTISGPTNNNTGAGTGTFTGMAGGSYIFAITDAQGCTTGATGVVGLTDNMFLSLGQDVTICAEASVTFDPQTNPETNIFSWTGIGISSGGTIANGSIKNAVASPLDTATYVLHAQWGSCERWDTITVNVLRKPVANAGLDTAICNITYAILRGSATNVSGAVNYAWTPAADVEFPDQAVTRVYPPGSDQTYSYTLTVTDDYGCNFSVTDVVDVRVQPPVPAYAGNDTTAVRGVPHQLFASGGDDYLWTPSGPLNSATAQNPLATLPDDQQFVVRVTDFAGCIGYDTVFVKVYAGPAYYVPNAFTPNGDGLNDVFRPVPAGIVRTEYFRIFNRYGETVFETSQYMKGWDGTFRGKKQGLGAYVWVIKGTDRNGKKVEMKGTVMLLQ